MHFQSKGHTKGKSGARGGVSISQGSTYELEILKAIAFGREWGLKERGQK